MKNVHKWWSQSRNPIRGCHKISPGCDNCYALDLLIKDGFNPYNITFNTSHLTIPQLWKKSERIFMESLGDVFNSKVPDAYIDRIFDVMRVHPHHTFFTLTKRHLRMQQYCNDYYKKHGFFPKNVWLGVTAEDQQRADERIPVLLETIAYNHFVSVEPMIEPIKITFSIRRKLKLVIAGGENIYDPKRKHLARYMNPEWARDLRDQCFANGVKFFFKQMTNQAAIPADLNIQQYPLGLR